MENFLTETNSKLEELWQKKKLELDTSYTKEHMLNSLRLELMDQKMQKQEWVREMRKLQYSEVLIRDDGELEIATRQSLINLPNRRATNFKFLDLLQLESVDGDGPVYVLFLQIGKEERRVYLRGEKVGKGAYLLKKLTEVGGKILIDSPKKKAEFLLDFWTSACCQIDGKLIIPVERGWMKTSEGEYRLVREGDILWKTIIQKTR